MEVVGRSGKFEWKKTAAPEPQEDTQSAPSLGWSVYCLYRQPTERGRGCATTHSPARRSTFALKCWRSIWFSVVIVPNNGDRAVGVFFPSLLKPFLEKEIEPASQCVASSGYAVEAGRYTVGAAE